MIRPATLNLAGGRWEPFIYDIAFPAIDLTGATLAMQVRAVPDSSGTPLVDLTLQAAPAEGLSFSVATVDGQPESTVRIRVNETTMEGLPLPTPLGDAAVFYWDMQVTRPGVHEKVRYFKGTFTVESGETH